MHTYIAHSQLNCMYITVYLQTYQCINVLCVCLSSNIPELSFLLFCILSYYIVYICIYRTFILLYIVHIFIYRTYICICVCIIYVCSCTVTCAITFVSTVTSSPLWCPFLSLCFCFVLYSLGIHLEESSERNRPLYVHMLLYVNVFLYICILCVVRGLRASVYVSVSVGVCVCAAVSVSVSEHINYF